MSNANSFITKPATANLKKTYAEAVDGFADWILARKRRYHPHSLYIVGIQGTLGRGKSVFSQKLADALNARLRSDEGVALTRSLDDYYWPRRIRLRPEFQARGYHLAGLSNRGPAGTHDLPLLIKNIKEMEKSSSRSHLYFPIFDKQSDDRSSESMHHQGRVGIFILEGWFVGAAAPKKKISSGTALAHSVALALKAYKKIFSRLDALWVFKAPAYASIVRERIEQQKSLDRKSNRPGMTPSQIRRFVHYFYKESWIPGLTTPVPPAHRVTFWATMGPKRNWIKVQKALKSRSV